MPGAYMYSSTSLFSTSLFIIDDGAASSKLLLSTSGTFGTYVGTFSELPKYGLSLLLNTNSSPTVVMLPITAFRSKSCLGLLLFGVATFTW